MTAGSGLPRRNYFLFFRHPGFLIAAVALLVWYRFAGDIDDPMKTNAHMASVTVVDGDTVKLPNGDRFRLAHIDTPEEGEPFYEESKQYLTDLIAGRSVRIEYARPRRDKFGRLLGYLYVDSLPVSEAILRGGLGYILLFKKKDLNDARVRRLLEAQREAVQQKRKLHSLDREREPYYPVRNGRFRFHRPGCQVVRDWAPDSYERLDSRERALCKGLSPCRRCRP